MSDEAKIPTSEELLALADGYALPPDLRPDDAYTEAKLRAWANALAASKPAEPTREAAYALALKLWAVHPNDLDEAGYVSVSKGGRYDNPRAAYYADAIHALYAPALAAARAEGERAGIERAANAAEGPTFDVYNDGSTPQYRGGTDCNWTRESDYGRGRFAAAAAVRALPVPDLSPRPAEEVEAAVLAERGNYEAFSDFHDQQWMEAINYAADVELIETNAFIRAWREGSCEEHADPLGEWAAFRQWREAQRARTAPAKKVGRGCRSALSGVDNVSE